MLTFMYKYGSMNDLINVKTRKRFPCVLLEMKDVYLPI